uniref:F-box domain-containing protein n=1 Tax=Mycena chlorophos TaxID=658473 RepID=A0ABQ0M0X7_MYCCL|nr:predicted protein [Mycena chlorophos]
MASLPLELIHSIAVYACQPQDDASKAPWSAISPLADACRAYRPIALEHWFRVLRTRTPTDVLAHYFPNIGSWTRELDVSPPQEIDRALYWNLARFRRLQRVRVNDPRTPQFLAMFRYAPDTLVELDIREFVWPRPNVFFGIASAFPNLQILRTSQRQSWCDLCYTCCNVQLGGEIPSKLVYTDGLGLPVLYARTLSSLEHLRFVSITVPCWQGKHIVLDPKDPYKELWVGECQNCTVLLFGIDGFRDGWMARKRGDDALASQRAHSSTLLYIKPPSLQTVEWVFQRQEGPVEEIEEDEATEDDTERDA